MNVVCFYLFIHLKLLLNIMATFNTTFTASMLYETAYSIPFNWQHHLPPDVYNYHSLIWKETNAPVDLHMGVVLPFVSSCLGTQTKGFFLTRATVLNLFWINVAASGVGKSVTHHRFISEPLDYMIQNSTGWVPDFEISHFTRPGEYFCMNLYYTKVFNRRLQAVCIMKYLLNCELLEVTVNL